MPLKVRYDPVAIVTEGDRARRAYAREVRRETVPTASLETLLSAVFAELGFFGGPVGREEMADELRDTSERLDHHGVVEVDDSSDEPDPGVGPVPVVRWDSLFDDLYGPEAGRIFRRVDASAGRLIAFLRGLEDETPVQEALAAEFGAESFELRPECVNLTAYELRRRYLYPEEVSGGVLRSA